LKVEPNDVLLIDPVVDVEKKPFGFQLRFTGNVDGRGNSRNSPVKGSYEVTYSGNPATFARSTFTDAPFTETEKTLAGIEPPPFRQKYLKSTGDWPHWLTKRKANGPLGAPGGRLPFCVVSDTYRKVLLPLTGSKNKASANPPCDTTLLFCAEHIAVAIVTRSTGSLFEVRLLLMSVVFPPGWVFMLHLLSLNSFGKYSKSG
jgi:hypothetical protein